MVGLPAAGGDLRGRVRRRDRREVRDGQVGNRPFYAAIGLDLAGHKDVLDVWAGTSGAGESAKYSMSILTELKNRGVEDIFFLVCDG
jgi:transposase-like protein